MTSEIGFKTVRVSEDSYARLKVIRGLMMRGAYQAAGTSVPSSTEHRRGLSMGDVVHAAIEALESQLERKRKASKSQQGEQE